MTRFLLGLSVVLVPAVMAGQSAPSNDPPANSSKAPTQSTVDSLTKAVAAAGAAVIKAKQVTADSLDSVSTVAAQQYADKRHASDTTGAGVLGDSARSKRRQALKAYNTYVTSDSTFFPRVTIFGSGNVKSVLAQPGSATSTTGTLGVRYEGSLFTTSASINIAGTTDTVRTGQGATLLTTAAGGSLDAGLIDVRLTHFLNGYRIEDCFSDRKVDSWQCNFGIHVYAAASSSIWGTGNTSVPTVNVASWDLGESVSYAALAGKVLGKEVGFVFDAGVAQRAVRGDLLSTTDTALKTLHQSLLHTNASTFFGSEFALHLTYTGLQASLEYIKMNGAVDGFSRGQVVAAITVEADIASGTLHGLRP